VDLARDRCAAGQNLRGRTGELRPVAERFPAFYADFERRGAQAHRPGYTVVVPHGRHSPTLVQEGNKPG